MEHKEYVRIVEHSKVAVLFIHGIVGTPNHFNAFLPLIPDTFSVYNLLLDGHGKGVKDFSRTSMKKWEMQVASVVEQLSLAHEKIYIVAHSLGTLLAIEQAITYKRVCRLFLLAVPLRISLKSKMFINSSKVYFDNIRSDDYEALAAKECYGIERDVNPLHYIGWIPRYLELFAKIRRTRKRLHLLNTPCLAYQSKKDEMVSNRSLSLLNQNTCIHVHELERSGHYCYHKEDLDFLLSEFSKMLNMND